MFTYTIKANETYTNSNEVYFSEKPNVEILEALKAMRFRWNVKKSCWYGFHTAEEITAAIVKHTPVVAPAPVRNRRAGRFSAPESVAEAVSEYKSRHAVQEVKQEAKAPAQPETVKAVPAPVAPFLSTTPDLGKKQETLADKRKAFAEAVKTAGSMFSIDETKGYAYLQDGVYLVLEVLTANGKSKVRLNLWEAASMSAQGMTTLLNKVLAINPAAQNVAGFLCTVFAAVKLPDEKEQKKVSANRAKLEAYIGKQAKKGKKAA